jgi:hypothetical protein
MKTTIAILALLAAGSAATAQKQGPAHPPPEKIKQVLVYGEDKCPAPEEGELLICGRMDERERYRIPKTLRGDPKAPENQSWANKVKAVEYVGRTGTLSCTPVGGGGFTGCLNQMIDKAYAEKAADSTWASAVAAERAKRLAKIDAESEAIEAQAQLDEAAAKPPPAGSTAPRR